MGEYVDYSLSEAEQSASSGNLLSYLPLTAFQEVLKGNFSPIEKTALFAQMVRFNALYMISCAGSGHLGSSFSSLDIVSWLYLNVLQPEDRYFSSKGHDSPGLYAIQTALGILPFEKIHALRRLGGLPGHPDVNTPGAYTNTGSLGMGVSKAKGFLFADDLLGIGKGRVFVLTGDGELQEGQFWESLVTASRLRNGRLTVIVDHNKIQSDSHVSTVSDLGDLSAKFLAFGWDVVRCDGHDFQALQAVLGATSFDGRPRVVIADTIKGKGVSFMEHTSMEKGQEYYQFHSGAPTYENYKLASAELFTSIQARLSKLQLAIPALTEVCADLVHTIQNTERMIPIYAEAIIEQAYAHPNVVALDADLILDTGLIPFKKEFPERFIECGIAEQDMVSQAGTMALSGLIPIVHSFACFLTSRASEQIYNNCTQGKKVIYVGSLAGLLPSGPGHSHQAVRDITAMSGMPGMAIIEPVNATQLKAALRWAIADAQESAYLRLTSIPYEQTPELARISTFKSGQGDVLQLGDEVAIIAFGPIMAFQALEAAAGLAHLGISASVAVTPWVNRLDPAWLTLFITPCSTVITLENHYSDCGAGNFYISRMAGLGLLKNRRAFSLGVDSIPACGRNNEVLLHHRLTGDALVAEIMSKLTLSSDSLADTV